MTVRSLLPQQPPSLLPQPQELPGEWKKGHRYTYNLQLDKNDITLKSVEIKAWTEKDGGSQDVPPIIE